MSLSDSLRSFWAWLNSKTVAPWAVVILTAIYVFARLDVTVAAQAQQVIELKQETSATLAEIKADARRDHEETRADIIERLVDIKMAQRALDEKVDDARKDLDAVKDQVRDVRTNIVIVCEKVAGRCRGQ